MRPFDNTYLPHLLPLNERELGRDVIKGLGLDLFDGHGDWCDD